jgi:hypothetical protein
MTVFYAIALALLLANALPCAWFFGVHLATGQEHPRLTATKFLRWSVLVVLVTFNVTIFRHVILIIVNW